MMKLGAELFLNIKMKVTSSIQKRCKGCKFIRRRGVIYVIC